MNTKKIICYARTSTRDQTTANQIPELERKAESLKQELGFPYEILHEQESTAKTRPVKDDIIKRCRAGEVVAVIVWKLDRWARSTTELNLNFDELKSRKIRFISLRDGLDLNPNDISALQKMQYGMLAVFAEFERDIIKERIFSGLDRAKREGKQLGRRQGSKDKNERRKSGYWSRWSKQTPPQNIVQS